MVSALEEYYLKNFIEGMETQAKLLSTFLTPRITVDEGGVYVTDIIDNFQGTRGLDIVVLDRFSRVVGSSGTADIMGRRMITDEITRALTGNRSESIHINKNSGQRYYALAFPLKDGATVSGVLYLSGSLENIDQTLGEIKSMMITGFVVVLTISFTIGMILARTIASPIKEVTRQAAAMAKGDFNSRITAYSNDEIGQLVNMYNYLARRLDNTLNEITSEKSKIEAILNNMRDGVLALDGAGEIVHINPAAANIIDSISPEPEGLPPRQLLQMMVGREKLDEFFSSRRVFSVDVTWEAPYRVIRVSLGSFHLEGGKADGTVVVLQDITREKELSIRQQEFVANVSHELKTPLTSMMSYIEALIEGALEDRDTAGRFLQVVHEETGRMSMLVKDLLELSRYDNLQEEIEKTPVVLTEIIDELISRVDIKNRNRAEIKVNIPEDLGTVKVDRRRIYQVIANLVDNALKYTPADGLVVISAGKKKS